MKQITVQYSGGTDSTATVALVAEKFDRVHLVTYKHSGISNVENSKYNITKLKELYGQNKFVHHIADIDRLFKMATYANYVANLRKYGFFNLATCGLCKLAMHLKTLVYCLENNIREVADGANKNSSHFPAQMKEVIDEFQKMYNHFDVIYSTPVFELGFPEDIDWLHKLGLASFAGKSQEPNRPKDEMTTGRVLFNKGILPEENVKGKSLDRKMQARCFQLTLLNAFALGYYIPKHGMEKYREITALFYKEKIEYFSPQVEQYMKNKRKTDFYYAIKG